MSKSNIEELIGNLYDMVQDARSMPLAMDKCILERDKVLDLLDEIIAQLPVELNQAKTIVESRRELISHAKREAEAIIKDAQEKAKTLVSQEQIVIEAREHAKQLAQAASNRAEEIRKAGNTYMDQSLKDAEEVIAKVLNEVRTTRAKFQTFTEKQENKRQNMDIDN